MREAARPEAICGCRNCVYCGIDSKNSRGSFRLAKLPATLLPGPSGAPEEPALPAAEEGAAGAASLACAASVGGIGQCLRMLAEEAASLGLAGTVRAIWVAIAISEHEAAQAPRPFTGLEPMHPIVPSVN
jgi:hypothetical protein